MELTDSSNECPRCGELGSYDEYGGMCGGCYVKLTPQQRAVLRGEEPPVREVIEHRTITERIPPRRYLWFVRLWRVGVSAAVAWLAYRQMGR